MEGTQPGTFIPGLCKKDKRLVRLNGIASPPLEGGRGAMVRSNG